jgi:hypothetical protein
MNVFEYGSDGSTIFLARRTAQVFSVEHDQNWCLRVDSGMSFETSGRTKDAHPDRTFDLDLVDGVARAACTTRQMGKIRTGGCVILDDSNEYWITNFVDNMRAYPRTDFFQNSARVATGEVANIGLADVEEGRGKLITTP